MSKKIRLADARPHSKVVVEGHKEPPNQLDWVPLQSLSEGVIRFCERPVSDQTETMVNQTH